MRVSDAEWREWVEAHDWPETFDIDLSLEQLRRLWSMHDESVARLDVAMAKAAEAIERFNRVCDDRW